VASQGSDGDGGVYSLRQSSRPAAGAPACSISASRASPRPVLLPAREPPRPMPWTPVTVARDRGSVRRGQRGQWRAVHSGCGNRCSGTEPPLSSAMQAGPSSSALLFLSSPQSRTASLSSAMPMRPIFHQRTCRARRAVLARTLLPPQPAGPLLPSPPKGPGLQSACLSTPLSSEVTEVGLDSGTESSDSPGGHGGRAAHHGDRGGARLGVLKGL
jgi:hypothetical protein